MKRPILFLAILSVLCLATTRHAEGQGNPFSAKQRTLSRTAVKPKPVAVVPGPGTRPSRPVPGVSPVPVTHPWRIGNADLPEGNRWFDGSGQMIFFAGTIAGIPESDAPGGSVTPEACFAYLGAIAPELGISDAHTAFRPVSSHTDELGMVHARMQQYHRDVPVYGREVWLHARDGKICLFNGRTLPTRLLPDVTPTVASATAQATALSDLSTRTILTLLDDNQQELLQYSGPVAELVIYPKQGNESRPSLAWHFTIRPNFIERWEYFISATDGSLIHCYNNTHTDGDVTATGPDLNGVNRTIHCYQQGGSYLMVDISRAMYNPQNQEGTMRVFDANFTSPFANGFNPSIGTSSNNTWSPKVISAQYNAAVTYEHHRTQNNRNSWNNQGGSVLSVVNCTNQDGSGLDNAFWNGVGVLYGNGASYFKPLQGALDVVAHELGHAYDEGSANLEYQYQSGALNEAFADIAAVVVERLNWQCGEDIVKPGVFPGGCLRDMSNPHNGGSSLSDPGYQPAHVNEMYNGSDDNGGVHINSGIINFAFYKFCAAMGIDKGEKVFLRALFNYLTRSSQFIDCRLAVVQAAKDLYGNGSAEVTAAGTAFDEVGITDGSGGNYQDPLQVNPGPDFILSYDLVDTDPNTLYVSSTEGTNYVAKSQTRLLCKPSVTDDGTVAVFIGDDHRMHAINLTGNPQEIVIQDEPIWSGVAISKDGTMIAAVTEYQDSSIYIYSYQKQEWVRAMLYNPTTQQGVATYNVLYADALEWDYGGEYLIYDAYNQMNSSSTGQNVDYWDISYLRVWDKPTNNWGDGAVFKMVSGIPEGVSIGNPSLSKNSPAICAFDYFDAGTNQVTVLAGNLETGDFAEVWYNQQTLGFPNYSKLDNTLIFSATQNDGSPVVARIAMSADKIHPAENQAYVLIPDAKWGIWFAQGNRPLAVPDAPERTVVRTWPNPASGEVTIALNDINTAEFTVRLTDMRGMTMQTTTGAGTVPVRMDLNGLTTGLYLLHITGQRINETRKLVVGR